MVGLFVFVFDYWDALPLSYLEKTLPFLPCFRRNAFALKSFRASKNSLERGEGVGEGRKTHLLSLNLQNLHSVKTAYNFTKNSKSSSQSRDYNFYNQD